MTNWGPMLATFADALLRHDGQAIRADFEVQSLVRALDATTSPLDLAQLASGLGLTGVQIGTTGNDSLVARHGDRPAGLCRRRRQRQLHRRRRTGRLRVRPTGSARTRSTTAKAAESGDRIRLALLNPDDVTIHRVGVDLVIDVNGTSDRITIQHQYDAPTVMLSGLPLSRPITRSRRSSSPTARSTKPTDIAAAIGRGTPGNDIIDGTAFSDEIEGLTGDDLLRGGDGGDNYYYTLGDGHDTIQDDHEQSAAARIGHAVPVRRHYRGRLARDARRATATT